MNIVLVHLGDNFFDYIIDCIDQIQKFNDCPIYLIISNKHKDKFNDININLLFTEELSPTAKHQIFEKTTRLDRNSIGASGNPGFWKFATERFFYIEDAMMQYNLENVFHLENDNLIYFNIKDYIDVFESEYNIGVVFDNDNRCIPGFMYIKNLENWSNFTQFIIDNNGPNDMELLPMFNKKYNSMKTLPIIPKDYTNLHSRVGHVTNEPSKYYNNIDKFNSVFDGAAIGQYLFGTDPFKDSSIGFVNESSLFTVSDFEFHFIDHVPYLKYNGIGYRINNIHVHSKRLKIAKEK